MSSLTVRRKSRETDVTVRAAEAASVDTGLPFFDHMLSTLLRYADLGWEVRARGDLQHHIMEDVAIAVGVALQRHIPARAVRYGQRTLPMDDALVEAVVDVGGRAYYRGKLPNALYEHVLRSISENARITLHVRVRRGRDRHHIIEAAMKAVGLALRQALAEGEDVFSTKGAVDLEVE
ncbi:MAG: imidazoleglycerol-phosphate dehydratase [Myxococcaceae bacterium]